MCGVSARGNVSQAGKGRAPASALRPFSGPRPPSGAPIWLPPRWFDVCDASKGHVQSLFPPLCLVLFLSREEGRQDRVVIWV